MTEQARDVQAYEQEREALIYVVNKFGAAFASFFFSRIPPFREPPLRSVARPKLKSTQDLRLEFAKVKPRIWLTRTTHRSESRCFWCGEEKREACNESSVKEQLE